MIFQEAGFDIKVLGEQRIISFTKRMKKTEQRLEGFTDLHAQNTERPRTKERTTEQELEYLRHKVALQEQQIDALKKGFYQSPSNTNDIQAKFQLIQTLIARDATNGRSRLGRILC